MCGLKTQAQDLVAEKEFGILKILRRVLGVFLKSKFLVFISAEKELGKQAGISLGRFGNQEGVFFLRLGYGATGHFQKTHLLSVYSDLFAGR